MKYEEDLKITSVFNLDPVFFIRIATGSNPFSFSLGSNSDQSRPNSEILSDLEHIYYKQVLDKNVVI